MSFFEIFKRKTGANCIDGPNAFSYDPGSLVGLYKHVAALSGFPILHNTDDFSRFVEKIGLKALGVLIANTLLNYSMAAGNGDETLSRRTFVYTLREELDGLSIATNHGSRGAVGYADDVVQQTLTALHSLYQAEGALREDWGYSGNPLNFINAMQMKLFQIPEWSKYHHQVKLRCYTMQYMHIAYMQVFANEPPPFDRDLFIKTFQKVQTPEFIHFLDSFFKC